MSGIVNKNAGRASGIVGAGDIGTDAVDSANIADDAIDSEHYTDGSIDNAHIADDAIDSEHYADGSIDNAHIADDAIDSEHYAAGSIDEAHIADNAVTLAKMAGGTDGNIISFDASGDPVAIATGNDGQVLTSAGAGSPPAFEAAAGGGDTRNFIIDGDFTQWPEGTSARTMTGSLYASALFQGNESTGGTATMERSTDVPTVGESNHSSKYSALFKCTGTDTSIAAGDLMLVRHFISGSDYAYLHGAQVITVSFWCKTASANNGDTYSLHLQNYGEGRSYVTDFTATSSWSKITKTITTDNSGTWLFSEADMGMKVGIGLVAGTNFQGTADSWEGANDLGTSSTSNFMDSTSNEFYISQLSLVKGSSAPDSFLGESISTVRNQVDWYIQRYDATGTNGDIMVMAVNTTAQMQGPFDFRREMMKIPTITFSSYATFRGHDGASDTLLTGLASSDVSKLKVTFKAADSGGTWDDQTAGRLTRDGGDTCFIQADARH